MDENLRDSIELAADRAADKAVEKAREIIAKDIIIAVQDHANDCPAKNLSLKIVAVTGVCSATIGSIFLPIIHWLEKVL